MLTFLKDGMPLLPDSLVVSRELFSNIRAERKYDIMKNSRELKAGKLEILLEEQFASDLEIGKRKNGVCGDYAGDAAVWGKKKGKLEKVLKRGEAEGKRSGMHRLPFGYHRAVSGLADAFYMGNREDALYCFQRGGGAGIGLTPSCDDAMVGLMAVMRAFMTAGQDAEGVKRYREIAADLETLLDERELTTQVSRKYLLCACEGRFAEPLCALTEWLIKGGEEFPAYAVEQILNTGHSSGMDTLYGMEAALERLTG